MKEEPDPGRASRDRRKQGFGLWGEEPEGARSPGQNGSEQETLAIDDKFEDDITNLIDAGKEKGYLTYGDVNDMMPEEMTSADDIDDLITTIGTQGIDLLDGPKFGADKD